jgi:Lipopolysaccharide-assembly
MDARRGVALLALMLLLHAGCGYALAGRGSFLPAHIKVVGIPELTNKTSFTGIETVFTQKIREEFIGRGRFKLDDVTRADALLTGEIVGVTATPAGLTDQGLASRIRFTVSIKAQFTDVMTKEVLWSNDALVLTEEYEQTVRGPIEAGTLVSQLPSAVQRLAADLARTLVTSVTEAF